MLLEDDNYVKQNKKQKNKYGVHLLCNTLLIPNYTFCMLPVYGQQT